MKYVLILLVFSSWNGAPIDHKEITAFQSMSSCQKEADKLNKRYQYPRYICGEKL